MGLTPRDNDITMEFDCQFRAQLDDSSITSILKTFIDLLHQLLMDFMRIGNCIRRKLGLLGSLTTYRVVAKVGEIFGWAVNKMTIWSAFVRSPLDNATNTILTSPLALPVSSGSNNTLTVTN